MQISISNIVKGTVIGSAFTAISRYFTRVTQAGAIYEKPLCVESGINSSPLLQQASMLMIPSGYKGGTAYAELPSNGNGDLTWTRGGDAFRTNASGLLQRVPWNLLQQSETFDNAIWGKTNGSITTNSTTAPNGTATADTYIPNTVNSYHPLVQTITVTSGTQYTFSIYVKSAGYDYLLINTSVGSASGNVGPLFNLSTGTLIGSLGGNNYGATITSVANGFYRIVFSYVTNATSTVIDINPLPTSSISTYSGNGTSGLYLWGAQLVEGTTAQTYLPTTDRLNFPRLSYMYGSCPSALLEPQRTNLATYSNDFTNAVWSKSGATITANSTTSPDGNTNASTIVFSGTDKYVTQGCLTLGTNVTTSVWIKGTSGETITVACGGTDQLFTLNGSWQRLSVNRASTTNIYTNINTFLGATARTIYVYGFQAEIGSYPTTYIPTTSAATATRVADTFSRSNIYTNGLISASGGTWFVELRNNVTYTRDVSGNALFIGDNVNGNNNGLLIRNPSPSTADRFNIIKIIGGIQTGLFSTTTSTIKIAIKWNGTSADVFVNGTKQVSATAFTTTNMEFIGGSGQQQPTFIQQMALFPTPLSDTDCTTLTTL